MNGLQNFDIRARTPVLLLIAVAWFVLALGFALLINLPRSEQAVSMKNALGEFDHLVAQRQKQVAELDAEFQRVVDGVRSLETFYGDVLSTKLERMTAVQREIRAIAGRFNINPEAISYKREIYETDQIVQFSASLPLKGSYEHLRAFIDAIENSANFITIQSITLESSKEGGIMLALNISVSTYFFDPDILAEESARRRRT
jgi:Tfp pilus assembly protein PilO